VNRSLRRPAREVPIPGGSITGSDPRGDRHTKASVERHERSTPTRRYRRRGGSGFRPGVTAPFASTNRWFRSRCPKRPNGTAALSAGDRAAASGHRRRSVRVSRCSSRPGRRRRRGWRAGRGWPGWPRNASERSRTKSCSSTTTSRTFSLLRSAAGAAWCTGTRPPRSDSSAPCSASGPTRMPCRCRSRAASAILVSRAGTALLSFRVGPAPELSAPPVRHVLARMDLHPGGCSIGWPS